MVLISLASYLAVSGVMSAVAVVVVTGDVSQELLKIQLHSNALSAVLSSRIGLFPVASGPSDRLGTSLSHQRDFSRSFH